jgi:FAD dependent oxidoreductase
VRVDNLLPACKNLGTTRITNGAYWVHPVEWSIGEASGALAAFALGRKVPPRAVRADAGLLAEFQQALRALGVMLEWPEYGALTATRRAGYRPPRAERIPPTPFPVPFSHLSCGLDAVTRQLIPRRSE